MKSSDQPVEAYAAGYINGAMPGFSTNSRTRPLIIAKMEEMLRNNLITIYSSRLIQEMETFIWSNGGKAEAMRSYSDDLIMSFAIGCWIKGVALQINEREVAYQKAFLSCFSKEVKTLDTTCGVGDGGPSPKQEHLKNINDFAWIYKG
jgi:hypothetical protein